MLFFFCYRDAFFQFFSLRRIHEKYETVQQTIHELLQDKRPDKDKEKLKGKEYVY